ncbi:MAG: MBL fold metallo-hydrolase [Candidatus Acidiferrum sp.]|jgi:glyoxylase-like metal-dependent hydrolase (beta-lactamase superfamily II)
MTDLSMPFSRRGFLTRASYAGALYSAAKLFPFPAIAAELADDPRVSQTVIADKGFASVRKVGDGLYATISDPSKGTQTLCNGGFLVGKDSAFVLEGFISAPGAAFQWETLQGITQVPVKAAMDTHYHYDHSTGNAFYGANGTPLWAHADTAKRIVTKYGVLQGVSKSAALAREEKAVKEAKTELAKTHRQGYLDAMSNIFDAINATTLTLPNHPLSASKLPLKVDLGGLTAVIEHYPGHSGTDLIVRVPEQNVVYTGDLLFSGIFPVTFDDRATNSGWRQTLKTFASWDKDTLFVPGHGAICGQEGVALFRSLFDDIEEQAEKLHKAGVPVSEAVDRYVIPEKFKNISPFAWDFSIGPTVAKFYAEWGAK